jgi:plasmid stabilization system protein ParE
LAKVIYTHQALIDLERLADFLVETPPHSAAATIDLITETTVLLERHPYIGSLSVDELRGLIISQGKSGHVALYSYEENQDTVLILAIRHQREAGYAIE